MEQLDVDSALPCVGMDHEDATHGSLNISDVIEVLRTTDPEYVGATSDMYSAAAAGGVDAAGATGGGMDDARKRSAYVKLLEQPASKALRFRYECEGRSAGSIPGVNSTPENKTFPSIQIVGYKGRAVVVVSCVTRDPPYRPHPHNLVGKEGCKKGVCTMELNNESMSVTFSNLGIQCVKKKDIEEALRVREEIRVDPYRTGFAHRNQPTSIDLNAVRLCFQVFLEGSVKGKFTFQLNPIVSDPIFDKKAMSDLVICKLSDCSCSVAGGKEIILLCEKVAKEDIQVRFYEERGGHVVWESYGDFQPTQVHKQVAISFRSPRYSSLEVDAPVKVNIQLRRPSDGATSEPLPFEFLPLDSGRPAFWSLRKALAKKGSYSMFSSILASNTAMLTSSSDVSKEAAAGLNVEPLAAGSGSVAQVEIESMNTSRGIEEEREDSIVEVEIMEQDEETPEIVNNETTLFQTNNNVVDNWPDTIPANNNNDDASTEVDNKSVELNFNEDATGDTCRSLNELLSQVAELDVIYSDRKAELSGHANNENHDIIEIDVQDMYNDNQTYSSLQMAFKNPIEVLGVAPEGYEDVMPTGSPLIINNKREMGGSMSEGDSKLPPLPPKRIKKSPPAVPTRPAHLFLPDVADPGLTQAPNKTLPPAPDPSPKSHGKPNIFQKFFSKKSPKSGSKKDLTSGSPRGSVGNVSASESLRKRSLDEAALVKRADSLADGELLPRNGSSSVNLTSTEQDFNPEVELTEAEHFALYTDVAPHATQSEFDEMSFYYSPVEGGKIVTPTDQSPKTDIAT